MTAPAAVGVGRRHLEKLATFPHAVASWVGDNGYPVQTPLTFEVDADAGTVRLDAPGVPLPEDREVNIIASHIRPQPGTGYDERRYVSLWGRIERRERGVAFHPSRAWGWDEAETPFFEYSERTLPQARRYFRALSEEQGREVRPRLSRLWTVLLTTRLPFLTATIVPVLLGIAVAAYDGDFNFWLALLTMIGACAVHIGVNTTNDVFDALSGADEANVNPTQFSGGSRVIQRGIVSLRTMALVAAGAWLVGIIFGLLLFAMRPSAELLVIGMAGVVLGVFYTAPPLKLVHRGLGEIVTALGFGPLMVLGAYAVQRQALSWDAFVASVPVAILVALILYVNEIPDRHSDARAGKRTLPVRFSKRAIATMFLCSALAAFATIVAGVVAGWLPLAALVALVALPMVFGIHRGIREHYDRPYELMPVMGRNIQLHLVTGLLLFAGYVIAITADAVFSGAPLS